jgi:Protein of unknown function (DUF4013)
LTTDIVSVDLNGYSDAFGWVARDPQWISKALVIGLIFLIPILGQIVMLGWMLASLDNLRVGRYELPPAGVSYIGRGLNLFVVQVVYAVAVIVVFLVLSVVGTALVSAGNSTESTGAISALGGLILALGYLVTIALGLCVALLTPVIILRTDRAGIGGGLNVAQVTADARRLPVPTLLAGLVGYVGHLISGLGSILCYVGVFLTVGYGYAVVAGVVRCYEQQLAAGGAPQPPPASPSYPTFPTSN